MFATPATSTDPMVPESRPRLTECVHCGLPIPKGRMKNRDSFCCNGCAAVYAIIHDQGFDRYYDLKTKTTAPPPELRPDTFAWLDRLEQNPSEPDTDRTHHLSLDVQGLHCAACVWLLQELAKKQPGSVDVCINPSLGKAEVFWTPSRTDLRQYFSQAEKFGYRFGPATERTGSHSRNLLLRLGLCVAAAMNVMVLATAFYFGLSPTDGILYELFGWGSLAFASVAFLAGGTLFIQAAYQGLRHGIIHLDLPIALGVILAYSGSLYAQIRFGPDGAYFDSVTIFITLMVLGRWLQERVLEKNRHALLGEGGSDNLFTRRCQADRLRAIRVTEINEGDEIWVVPGDLVPVNGELLGHGGEISLDWITGESDPRSAGAGEEVPAGAFNAGRGTIRLRATEEFDGSRLDSLLGGRRTASMTDEDASSSTADSSSGLFTTRFWRRISLFYVTAVLALASSGFLLWAFRDATRAVEVTIAILVVTCPCAIGLAVPLAHELIHLALRRRGVFLRSGRFLDRALSIKHVLFDKTGTITIGALALSDPSIREIDQLSQDERAILHHMTIRSNHPVSRCLAGALEIPEEGKRPDMLLDGNDEVLELPGRGLQTVVNGRDYRLGRESFAQKGSAESDAPENGESPTLFSINGRPLATFTFREQFKPDATEETARLIAEGFDVRLLSGDGAGRVRSAAERLGLASPHWEAGLSPEEKAARVIAIEAVDPHSTLMVGDGINDAPSFDAAWCAATPAVDRPSLPARADFYYLGEGIGAVRRALTSATVLRRVIRDNLLIAIGYNAIAITLCFAGLVSPVVAAILMPVSSIAVVSLTFFRLSGGRLAWMS